MSGRRRHSSTGSGRVRCHRLGRARASTDDDGLLEQVSPVLDSLYRAYTSSENEGSAK